METTLPVSFDKSHLTAIGEKMYGESFGKDEKPVFTEGGVIYVNQDHSLYQKQARLGKDNLGFYLAYLLSQQIALLVAETDSYKAFEVQSKLLSDCF